MADCHIDIHWRPSVPLSWLGFVVAGSTMVAMSFYGGVFGCMPSTITWLFGGQFVSESNLYCTTVQGQDLNRINCNICASYTFYFASGSGSRSLCLLALTHSLAARAACCVLT